MGVPLYLPPPAVAKPFTGTVPSGDVRLYDKADWSGETLDLYLNDMKPGTRYPLTNFNPNFNNKATWIAFNLPVGAVVTLFETLPANAPSQPYDFTGCGRCVDLIGNGAVQTVNLETMDASNCIKALIWHQPDMSRGIFQLFQDNNFAKNRNTFFLSEWSNGLQSLAGWYLSGRVSSLYFGGLGDNVLRLYSNTSGSGTEQVFAGGSSIDELADLGDFSDKTQSWTWAAAQPYLPLPPVYTPYPNPNGLAPDELIPPGTVLLYDSAAWSGTTLALKTGSAVAGRQYAFTGTALENKATWIAFNLPAGVVMTLITTPTAGVEGEPYNFANCGICVDLIGNDQIQTVDLALVGADNCLSGYIWRTVRMSDGLFQLFENANFSGKRNTFFAGEWSQSVHSLASWAINGLTSSAYFADMTVQSFTLHESASTSANSISYAGWLDIGSVASLAPQGFDNKAAAWSWSLLNPLFSTVPPFSKTVEGVPSDPSLSITSTITGNNVGDATIVDEVSVTSENQQSMTLTLSDSQTVGSVKDFKWTVEESAEVDGTGEKSSYDVSLSFSQEHTKSDEKQTSVTETVTLQVDQQVAVPANCSYTSTLTIIFAAIPRTPFTAPALLYYDQPVPGSVLDADVSATMNRPIYVVRQDVSGFFGGGIAATTTSETVTTLLPPP